MRKRKFRYVISFDDLVSLPLSKSLAVTYDNPCVEKIAMLQNSLASKNERIDLLEDTNKSLIKEIQKKSRLIQNYAMEGGGSLAKRKLLHSTVSIFEISCMPVEPTLAT